MDAALEKLALLVAHDLVYAPIFERLDAEWQAAARPSPTEFARSLIRKARIAA